MGGDGRGDPRRHDAQPCEGLVECELAQAPPPWPLAPGLREPNSAYASAALRQPRGTPGRSWRIEAATQAELARLYAERFQVHARNDVPAHRVALSDRWPSCASPWDWIDREARVIAMTSRRSPSWPRCHPCSWRHHAPADLVPLLRLPSRPSTTSCMPRARLLPPGPGSSRGGVPFLRLSTTRPLPATTAN